MNEKNLNRSVDKNSNLNTSVNIVPWNQYKQNLVSQNLNNTKNLKIQNSNLNTSVNIIPWNPNKNMNEKNISRSVDINMNKNLKMDKKEDCIS